LPMTMLAIQPANAPKMIQTRKFISASAGN
jgi:hypothetical protein